MKASMTGPEFRSMEGFMKDHTNSLYVTMLYYVILERAPSPAELSRWLDAANSGGPGIYFNQAETGPSAGLTGSAEFLARFK